MTDELVFLPLGGSGEIGMNLNLYGFGPPGNRQWMMIDCGVTFAGDDLPGIDLITPDIDYLLDDLDQGSEFLGLVLTHGHEDHIGAVAHLWPSFEGPIYATPFTAELVRRKFVDVGIDNPPLHIKDLGSRFDLGPFDIEYITLTHSIPEPNAIAIRTPLGLILHTGDFKIDPRPVLGEKTDRETLEALGREGVLAMMCDSTNVFSDGHSGSESDVAEALTELIKKQKQRVAVTTFASNVSRVVSICRAAVEADRSVCLLGRSMLRMVDVARHVGLLPDGVSFVDPGEAGYLPNDKVLYLCTGSQGEDRAALARIARDEHPELVLNEGDTVIFSSKIIPGNERQIYELMNQLTEMGCEVITEKDAFVHVSGHPNRDELKDMYQMVQPEIAIPVHGEGRHLAEHGAFATTIGAKRSIVPKNGDLIRIAPGRPEKIDEVPAGRLYLDGKILVPEGDNVLRERRRLAEEGVIVVTVAIDDKGNIRDRGPVFLKGIPSEDEEGEVLEDLITEGIDAALDALPKPRRMDDREVELQIRRAIRSELTPRWGKRSEIAVLILRV
ncbi:ribonuclease J [Parvularcula lutaonensis]|uniref:Ribonuclease J n=1 Tax=Parvularcula lutaonensis TaxID=491923 RepID=A0ABV7M9S9_9PROT|nr:ribonuclease J [Parvularcula lutaonensis]GGY43032.1 RNase J family beta-CASP ribonuclease [Parvularcula lutaonensis]